MFSKIGCLGRASLLTVRPPAGYPNHPLSSVPHLRLLLLYKATPVSLHLQQHTFTSIFLPLGGCLPTLSPMITTSVIADFQECFSFQESRLMRSDVILQGWVKSNIPTQF